MKERRTRPTGTQRPDATVRTGEIIDRYGRMLAYLARWFSDGASDPIPPKGRSSPPDIEHRHGRVGLGGAVHDLPVAAAELRPEPVVRGIEDCVEREAGCLGGTRPQLAPR